MERVVKIAQIVYKTKVQGAQLTESEALCLNKWLAQSEANKAYYQNYSFEKEYAEFERITRLSSPQRQWRILDGWLHKNRLRLIPARRWLRYAAGIVAVVGWSVAFSLMGTKHHPAELTDETVAQTTPFASSVTSIVLSDGSVIALREGSRLNQGTNFEGDTREVTLDGEAYFDIKSHPDKPFVIYTGNIKTTVLGTSFSIRAYSSDPQVVVTVTKGTVKVESEKRLLAILEADNQLIYNINTQKSTEKTVDAQKEVDWKSYELLYKNRTFAFIAQEIGKAYDVTIEFDSESLGNQLITAYVDTRDPVEKVLAMLCMSQRADFSIEDGIYKIKPLLPKLK